MSMIPSSYRPRKKFMELAVSEAKRARDRGDSYRSEKTNPDDYGRRTVAKAKRAIS
jgi:hypothetical protein